jgi:carotenoid cleavage dioxygenase-like enzyme
MGSSIFWNYLVMNFATQILQMFAHSLAQISFTHTFALALVYPFLLGFTVAFAAFPNKISLAAAAALAVSTFLYSGFGVFWAELYGINDQAYRFKRGYSCF